MSVGWSFPTPTRPAPRPTHRRAELTIRAAIDATVELLDELPERRVTFEAIRLRSGVSQGSLTHHFGSRAGLLAAAHVERYARSCRQDAAFLGRFAGTFTDAHTFAATMIAMIDDMLSAERRQVRWTRMSAIAAALPDPTLEATLRHSYTGLTDRLAAIIDDATASGVLAPDADVRTIALLVTMHAQGLVLDDLVGADVSLAAWNHLQVRFVASFLTPDAAAMLEATARQRYGEMWRAEVFGRPGRVPTEVAERLATVRRHHAAQTAAGSEPAPEHTVDALRALLASTQHDADPGVGRTSPSLAAARQHIVTGAIAQLRTGGASAVSVEPLREAAGLSPQAFHRAFGGRDQLVRIARIRLEITRSAHSVARFTRCVTDAAGPADFRRLLEQDATGWMAKEPQRHAMRQRIETLDATRTDAELHGALARVQRVTRDLLVEQVCAAQARGLIDPELPASGVARFLDGTPFWHVFHGLDDRRPDTVAWTHMLRVHATMLSPDVPTAR